MTIFDCSDRWRCQGRHTGGLPAVDREFYVMLGEIYAEAAFGHRGSQEFSVEKLLNERPEYFVFNGSVGGGPTSQINYRVRDRPTRSRRI